MTEARQKALTTSRSSAARAANIPGRLRKRGESRGERSAVVELARGRFLGDRIDRLNATAQAQVGTIMEKLVWRVAAGAVGVIAGLAVRKSLEPSWRRTRQSEPPDDPSAPWIGWGDAIAWTAATTMAMGVAKLIAVRGAAAGWRKATGVAPPDHR